MKILFCIICFIPLGTAWSQTETIKIEKDTVFNITDFVNFFRSDTAKSFSYLKAKYFKFSPLLSGKNTVNCSDKADNLPYTLVNSNFRMDYCMWNTGTVYHIELTLLNPAYLSASETSQQLHSLGFFEEKLKKEKKLNISRFLWTDNSHKMKDRHIIIRSRKNKIVLIEFY